VCAFVLCGAALLFGCCSAILKANCYHDHGHQAPCNYDGSYYMLMFGGAQLFLSFIPDFHDMAWLSVVAAVMSFSYAFIGLGLGMAKTIGMSRPLLSFTSTYMSSRVRWLLRPDELTEYVDVLQLTERSKEA
jgi:hypothetical protein